MNYYEVVIINDESKEKYLVKAKSTSNAETKMREYAQNNEVVKVQLTKYIDVLD